MTSPSIIICERTSLLSQRDRLPDWRRVRNHTIDEEACGILGVGYVAAGRREGTKARIKIAIALAVVLGTISFLGMMLALALEKEISDADTSQRSIQSNLLLMVDAKLELWEEWKEKTSVVGGWLQNNVNASVLREQAPVHGSNLGDWWNATVSHMVVHETEENAKLFGQQVQSWWSSADDESRSVGGVAADKEGIIESNFQTWWSSASAAEKSWWNATVYTMAHDRYVVGKWLREGDNELESNLNSSAHEINSVSVMAGREISNDANAMNRKIGRVRTDAENEVKQKTAELENAANDLWEQTTASTGKALENWFNSSKYEGAEVSEIAGHEIGKTVLTIEHEIGKDAAAVERDVTQELEASGNTAKDIWERTTTVVANEENTVATGIGQRWEASTGVLKSYEKSAAEKTGKLWHEAATAVTDESEKARNTKHYVAERTKEVWNATKDNVRNGEIFVADMGKEAWDTIEKETTKDEDAVGKTFVSWWNMAKAGTNSAWNGTEKAEQEWWNATQNWFIYHLQKQVEDPTTLPLLYLNSTDAYPLLMNGFEWYDFSADFFLILSGFDAQINQAYSAVAAAAAVLNSFRGIVDLPIDPVYNPHSYATQQILLENVCVNANVIHVEYGETANSSFNGIFHPPGGLNLDQTEKLLACHLPRDWNISTTHVNPNNVSVEQIRQDIVSALMNPFQRVLVHYDRSVLGQEGTAHFSPLGSYSKKRDSFLILDVAKYKYPPVW